MPKEEQRWIRVVYKAHVFPTVEAFGTALARIMRELAPTAMRVTRREVHILVAQKELPGPDAEADWKRIETKLRALMEGKDG